MNAKQKLFLFLISCDPGIKSVYKMILIFDRADFPANLKENLTPLLEKNLICVTAHSKNGHPSVYGITEKGRDYLNKNLIEIELIEHIKSMQNPDLLLQITQAYFDKKKAL